MGVGGVLTRLRVDSRHKLEREVRTSRSSYRDVQLCVLDITHAHILQYCLYQTQTFWGIYFGTDIYSSRLLAMSINVEMVGSS